MVQSGLLSLILAISRISIARSQYDNNIECDAEYLDCSCPQNGSCSIVAGAGSAEFCGIINCPTNYDCYVECGGGGACDDCVINCPKTGSCNIDCGGGSACDNTYINCPLDPRTNDTQCLNGTIDCGGGGSCLNMTISDEPYNDTSACGNNCEWSVLDANGDAHTLDLSNWLKFRYTLKRDRFRYSVCRNINGTNGACESMIFLADDIIGFECNQSLAFWDGIYQQEPVYNLELQSWRFVYNNGGNCDGSQVSTILEWNCDYNADDFPYIVYARQTDTCSYMIKVNSSSACS